MGQITFQITGGTPNYQVELIPDIGVSWTYGSAGVKTIYDIPAGDYAIRITDDNGCVVTIGGIVIVGTTTTTTTTEEYTTTTSEIVCDYEGVLTVGTGGVNGYGYDLTEGGPGFGSINPSDGNIITIAWDDSDPYPLVIILLECYNEVTLHVGVIQYVVPFTSEDSGSYYYTLLSISNPFPGVGETCDIKLCYGIPCTTTTTTPSP